MKKAIDSYTGNVEGLRARLDFKAFFKRIDTEPLGTEPLKVEHDCSLSQDDGCNTCESEWDHQLEDWKDNR